MNTLTSAVGTLLLIAAGQSQAASTTFSSFGMKYASTTAQPPAGLVVNNGPTTGCTSASNSLAVGVEISQDGLAIVGVQVLCAQPTAAGFWTTPARANFIGRSGTSIQRVLCPSSMAIGEVRVQSISLTLACRELRPNLSTGIVKAGPGELSGDGPFEVPTIQAACPTTQWVQFFQPAFDTTGVLASMTPLCNGVLNGLVTGYPSTLIVSRSVGQQSELTTWNTDRFDVDLFNFAKPLTGTVQVEIRAAGNMSGTLQEADFNQTQFLAPCTPIFVPLNNGAQLFVGYRCTVNGDSFRSDRALIGHFVFRPRNPTTNEESLPILNINVLAPAPTLTNPPAVTGVDAAFPVVVHDN